MKGPQHYAAAEKLLVSCQIDVTESEVYAPVGLGHEDDVDTCRNALMAAQTHATLALVAATADARTEIIWREDGHGGYTSVSLTEREVDYQNGPKAGTWADVIRSTIGGQ